MTDLELVKACLVGDNGAWRIFFGRYRGPILRRIKQVFVRYGFQETDSRCLEAFDYVMDQFLFKRVLGGFKTESSLSGFVATVTTRATIDWYRSQSSAKQMYGARADLVANVEGGGNAWDESGALSGLSHDGDPNPRIEDPLLLDLEQRADFASDEERLCFRLLMIRYREISSEDRRQLAKFSGRSAKDVQVLLANLVVKLTHENEAVAEKFGRMQALYMQVMVLRGRHGQEARLERKTKQLEDLRIDYAKRGFEVFPSRQDLTELFNWDINKTDRLLRKVREKLRICVGSDRKEKKVRSIA